jgi:putative thioredoxin
MNMAAHSIEVQAGNFREVVLEGSKTRPVVIDFWAPWCAPCRALKPVLEKLAQEYAGQFTLATINSDENQQLAAEMGVRGIPAVKAVVDGNIVDEFVGALPEAQVRAFIERILPSPSALLQQQARAHLLEAEYEPALAALESVLELDPRNLSAMADKLEALMRLQRHDEAKALLQDLDPMSPNDVRVARLKAELEFAAEPREDPASLERRIQTDPTDLSARLELARHQAHMQAYEAAFEQLMELVRRDRRFGDDAGRKTMIELFNLLGNEHELVGKYRRLLSAALY